MAEGWSYPNTPAMQGEAPAAPSAAAPTPGPTPNPFPSTPGMRGDDGQLLAPEQPAETSGAGVEPDLAVLAAHYPIEFAEDFLPHEPTVASFRALAAKHHLPPVVVQDLATFYVAELRRIAEIDDPMEQVRAMYPATPQMRP